MENRNNIKLIICDFDNTLFDWFNLWYKSFKILLQGVINLTKIDEDEILEKIRLIHQKNRTSEYNRLLDDLFGDLKFFKNKEDQSLFYADILPKYYKTRKEELTLYPNVFSTLSKLKASGHKIVVYTESQPIYSYYRLNKLGLANLVDSLYAPMSHSQNYPESLYNAYDNEILPKISNCELMILPAEDKKPNPKVLIDILEYNQINADQAIYIGDSIMKDICMANEANITSIYANYGVAHAKREYNLLRKVSHWMDEDVKKEKQFEINTCEPTFIITDFSEIINLIDT